MHLKHNAETNIISWTDQAIVLVSRSFVVFLHLFITQKAQIDYE